MSRIKRTPPVPHLALTSPRGSYEVRGVVDDELKVVEEQDVDARGGGDPRAIWRCDKQGMRWEGNQRTDLCPLQT